MGNSIKHNRGRFYWYGFIIILICYLGYSLPSSNHSGRETRQFEIHQNWDKTDYIAALISSKNPALSDAQRCNIAENIVWASEEDKIDPYLVLSIAIVESSINSNAVSPTGVRGIMQVTNRTARSMANSLKLAKSDINLVNPSHNIKLGVRYLRYLMDRMSTKKAIQAYNVGEGALNEDSLKGISYYHKVSTQYKLILQDLLPLADSGYNVY